VSSSIFRPSAVNRYVKAAADDIVLATLSTRRVAVLWLLVLAGLIGLCGMVLLLLPLLPR
jgi:hypothetical protein